MRDGVSFGILGASCSASLGIFVPQLKMGMEWDGVGTNTTNLELLLDLLDLFLAFSPTPSPTPRPTPRAMRARAATSIRNNFREIPQTVAAGRLGALGSIDRAVSAAFPSPQSPTPP